MLALALLLAQTADAPEQIFACSFGARQVEVIREGATLVYLYGRRGRPVLVLRGSAVNGLVRYHSTLYPHGEDQTLRFLNGRYSYVIYNAFQTPDYRQEGAIDQSGLIVLRDGHRIARMDCRSGGDFIEREIFDHLPRDEENRVPR